MHLRGLSTRRRIRVTAVACATLVAGLLSAPAADARPAPEPPLTTMSITSPPGGPNVRVLLFHGSAAAGDESPVVNAGIEAIERIGLSGPADQRFEVEATDDASVFTSGTRLGGYNAVVFLTGGGDVLDPEQEAGLEAYMEAGGGFVGVHDAARAEPYSDWFTGLIGARPAASSPTAVQRATVEVGDRRHPATGGLPLEWKRPDLWPNWVKNPSGEVHTVARVRESTYRPGASANGADHPVSWCRDYDGGRSFYTGMGGTVSSYDETDFRAHLRGALLWTSRLVQADCKATITGNYKAERLTPANQPGQNDQIGEPHGLVTAPDGRVLYIGRGGADSSRPVITDWNNPDVGKGKGQIHVYDPMTKKVTLAGELTVFGNKGGGDELVKVEEGLLGIELDPRFEQNGWVYLHYTPTRASTVTPGWPSGGSPASHSTPPRTGSTSAARRCCSSGPCRCTVAVTPGAGWPGTRRATCTSPPVTTTPAVSAGVTPETTRSRTSRVSPSPMPGVRPETRTTSTARSCASIRNPTERTRFRRETCSRAARATRAAARRAARST